MSILMPFLKAWILGFAIAAPVGPIGLLCIRHSLTSGLRFGLAVGLGAALADSLYGFLVGGGMTVISTFLLDKAIYIKLIGGILLLCLALKEFKSKTIIKSENTSIDKRTAISLILTTLILTLTSPMTIMSFVGIFSTSIGNSFSSHEILIIISGIFCGSMSWWFLLSKIANFSKDFISSRILGRVKYFSAFILSIFGIYSILSSTLL